MVRSGHYGVVEDEHFRMKRRRSRPATPPVGTLDRTRLRTRAGAGLAVAFLAMGILVWLLIRIGSHHTPYWTDAVEPTGWNVLLVSFDTTRPDYLQACGGERVPTPALDRVANGGAVFRSAFSPAPITLPSHASLLTAQNPYRHGVRENTEHALRPGYPTLASALGASGYRTAAFVSSFVMDHRFGLGHGFQEYVDRLDGPEPGLGPGTVELPGALTARRASHWIREHAGNRAAGQENRPFFLFVHFFDAHVPYAPPSPFREQHPGDPYAGELASQDAALGMILDALDGVGESARTLVWVVSDHGESLGEHGESTHSLFVYDATQRVVSVVHLPSESGRFDGAGDPQTIHAQCGLVDVAPTLMGLLGVPTTLPDADGVSLLTLLQGRPPESRVLYMETHSPLISYGWAPLEAVRDAGWKLIRAPEPELYDLRADPGETHNLFGARPEQVARLEKELDAFLADASLDVREAARQPTPEELERLRSLGYVGGAGVARPDSVNRPDPKRMLHFFHETFQSAKTLLLQGRFEEAIAAFQQAIAVDPGNYSLYLFLAGAYRQAGKLDLADDAYREAVRLSPHSPRVWYGWGRAKLSAGAPDSASWAFRKSIELLPGSPDGWSALGESEFAAGRASQAVAAFDSAMARGGDPRSIHGWMARVYRDGLRDPGQAQKHLERYAALLGVTPDEASRALPGPAPEHLDDH